MGDLVHIKDFLKRRVKKDLKEIKEGLVELAKQIEEVEVYRIQRGRATEYIGKINPHLCVHKVDNVEGPHCMCNHPDQLDTEKCLPKHCPRIKSTFITGTII